MLDLCFFGDDLLPAFTFMTRCWIDAPHQRFASLRQAVKDRSHLENGFEMVEAFGVLTNFSRRMGAPQKQHGQYGRILGIEGQFVDHDLTEPDDAPPMGRVDQSG